MFGLKGPAITATVAFALAVIAAISLLISSLSKNTITVSTGVDHLRLFKGERAVIPLAMGASSGNWLSLASVSLAEETWAEGDIRRAAGGGVEVVVAPKIAGRFDGISAFTKEVDPLGLFEFRRAVKIDVEFESLPVALRRRGALPMTAFSSVGENPSGRVGMGQEMFGIAEYQRGLDTRDIMWKRAAKLDAESARLPLRVREASAKKSVKVGLAVGFSRDQQERLMTVDRVAEALGQLGKDLLLIGTTMEVFYAAGGYERSVTASTVTELADLVTGSWIDSDGTADPMDLARKVDLLILETSDPEKVRELAEVGLALLLVVSSSSQRIRLPPLAVNFTGQEDLTDLAGRMLTS